MHDLQVPSLPAPARLSPYSSSSSHPRLQKTLGVLGILCRVRGDGCPPPTPPGRADLSRGALDLHSFEFTTDLGRDQRESGPSLFIIKDLWTETKAGGGGGHAGEGPRPSKGRSWAPRPPLVPGAEAGSDGALH